MSHITTQQLSEMAGITKRHCQRLLVGGHVPDAVRTSGGHWSIPDSAKVRKWIAKQKTEKHVRKVLPVVYPSPVMPNKKTKVTKLTVGNELHKCLGNLEKVQAVMHEAIESARANAHAAGLILIAAYNKNPGGKWFPWLAENGIDHSEARRLINFAKLCERGQGRADTGMLKKFGVIKSKPRAYAGKVRSCVPQWMTWTGKIVSHFSQVKASQVDDMEKEAMAQQLKPIVDLYEKLSH
jgi:hypothetical protein